MANASWLGGNSIYLRFMFFLGLASAAYECFNASPLFQFLRPPEPDCIQAADSFVFLPKAEDQRLFVSETYSTQLPMEIVVPKTWRLRSCLVTIDLKEGVDIESSSFGELGRTALLLALTCFTDAKPAVVTARAPFGKFNQLAVILHGNQTESGVADDDEAFHELNFRRGY